MFIVNSVLEGNPINKLNFLYKLGRNITISIQVQDMVTLKEQPCGWERSAHEQCMFTLSKLIKICVTAETNKEVCKVPNSKYFTYIILCTGSKCHPKLCYNVIISVEMVFLEFINFWLINSVTHTLPFSILVVILHMALYTAAPPRCHHRLIYNSHNCLSPSSVTLSFCKGWCCYYYFYVDGMQMRTITGESLLIYFVVGGSS